MQRKLFISLIVLLMAAGVTGLLMSPDPASAMEPEWGKLTFESAYAAHGTADVEILGNPGTNYSWVITSVWYNVDVVEADKVVTIGNVTAPGIIACSIPLTIAKEGMIWFGDGVVCMPGSVVECDFTSTTAEVAFVVNAYKIYNPD